MTSNQPIISLPVGHPWCGIPYMVNFLIQQHPVERTRRGRQCPYSIFQSPRCCHSGLRECKTLCGFDQGAFDRSVFSKQLSAQLLPQAVLVRQLLFRAEICLYSYISGEFPRCLYQSIHCTGSLPRGLGTRETSKPCRILPRPHGGNTRWMNDCFSSIKYLNHKDAPKILIYLPLRLNTRSRLLPSLVVLHDQRG